MSSLTVIFPYMSLFTGSASEFHLGGQAANLFGPPVSTESRDGIGLFGTSMSPVASGCSIFGDASSAQQSRGSEEFTFSFGTTSPTVSTTNPTRPAFSLF